MGKQGGESFLTRGAQRVLAVLFAFCLTTLAEAQGAGSLPMTYSGRLTESSGSPKDGAVAIAATFWTAELDGAQLGQTFEFASVILNQGVFTLYFPFMASQVQDIFRDGSEPVFIEITSGGKAYPRQKFNYIPLAMRIPVDNKTLSFDTASGQLGIKSAKSATSGSILVSDGTGGVKWDNLSSNNLTVKTQVGSDPSSGQVLTFSNGKWVAASIPPGNISTSNTGTAGQVLTTNGSGTLTWVTGISPAGAAGGDLQGSYPNPTLSVVGMAGTYTKVITDSKGRVIASSTLTAADLPPSSASNLTNGTLAVSNGGTGVTAFTNNGVVIGSSSALSSTAAGSQYNILTVNASNQPTFGTVNLASNNAVNGTLGLANGGTGATTKSGAFDALSPMTASGDLIYGGTLGSGTRLSGNMSTAKQFLSSTGTGTVANAPVWAALTASDIPAHSASLITSGVLGVANGGTGAATTTANYVFAGPTTGTGAPSFRALVAGDLPAMLGADGSTAGTKGAVPSPVAADNVKFLRGDGTWATPAAAAAGSSNQIQYNSGGMLSSNANFVYSGGNVGIATTSPGSKLQVNGNAAIGYSAATAGPANGLAVSGNVGIGTTAPGQKISVAGIVESTTGGFKYPNGTIQTSASPAVGLVTLTDAATIAVDGSLGAVYKVTLGGNRTLANPTNLVPGAIYSFMFTQDATGSRSLTFGSSYHFPSGISTPALSSAAGVTDAASFVSDGTYLYYMSGFASATAPCYAPTNVTVTVGIGAANVTTTLTWYDTNSNETSYSIERSADGITSWTALTSVAANSTTAFYTDTNLGTQSYFWRATANCGVSGSNSSIALQGTSSVTTPTNLTQTRSGNTTALSWTDTLSEDSYQIERAVNGGAWGNITNPAQNVTAYTDTGLDPNTVYTYRIRAVQGTSYSAYGVASVACPTPATFTCGYAGNDCYSNINAVLGASAVTPYGRCLTMLYANGSSGFLVWKDQSSAKILSPNGLDSWSMALNLSGKGRSSTAFSDQDLGTASTILAGRACPTNVYIDDSNKVSSGNCLYYSPTYPPQYTNYAGDDSGAQLGFSLAGQWYSGNLATCSSKRMRLPTLYETTVSTNPGGWVANDAAPTFSPTTGVPSTDTTLTSSGENAYGGVYRWNGSSTSSAARGTVTPGAVRCVIP